MVDSPLDDRLRRAAHAVGRYRVPESAVGVAATSLASIPAAARSVLQVRVLNDAVLCIAETHQRECTPSNCVTCAAISDALAVVLATIRVQVDTHFEQRLTDDPSNTAD